MTTATATDSSVSGYNGTLISTPKRVIGKIGQGLSFDGSNNYIDIGAGKYAFTKTTPFSGSLWIKTTSTSAQTMMSNLNNGANPGWALTLSQVGGGAHKVNLILLNGAGTSYRLRYGSTSVDNGKWHHITFTYDGSNSAAGILLYVDGVLESLTTASDNDPGTFVDFGFRIGSTSIGSARFNGTMDDVRLYNRVITPLEVESIYKSGGGVVVLSHSTKVAKIKQAPSFTCGTSNVTDADGNIYNTLSIGAQCWMKQNMRVGTRIGVSTAQSNNGTIEKYCYSDTVGNCTSNEPNQPDGGLYQWNEAMQYSTTAGARGICPSGWHIPTHDQLTTMERAICTSGSCATDFPYDTSTTGYRGTNEGTKLKANGTSNMEVNLAGFSVSGSFSFRGTLGVVWSSSEYGGLAWSRYVNSGSAQVRRVAYGKSYGLSVRCLKD